MGEVKQINIKDRTYYFCSDITDLKNFDSRLLKIDKKSYENIDIYYIEYITIKKNDDCESTYSVNPLYLRINHASGYIKEKNGNKYLIFDSVDENKEVLKKHEEVWEGIKKELKLLMVAKELNMGKIFKKLNLILMMTCH